MGLRRKSREHAMKALFFMDIHGAMSQEMLVLYCNNFTPSKTAFPFFSKLIHGVLERRGQIDALIENYSDNWKISRMSCVDRNILRIAVYELVYCNDIPSKVTINEAIDVGKKFGTEESGAFINGIVDCIHRTVQKGDLPRWIHSQNGELQKMKKTNEFCPTDEGG